MITVNNIKKIVIVAIVLLLTACQYDNHSSIVKINTLDGKTDTINISYYDNLYISGRFELLDGRGAVKANFVKSFSQLQTK
jgi:hypothetical protein